MQSLTFGWLTHWWIRRAFLQARMGVYENLYALLTEVSSRTTETYAQLFARWSERDRQRKLDTWRAYHLIAKRLRNGMSLSDAMQPFIPAGETMILRAGEEAGRITEVLKSIIDQSEVMEQIRNEMMGALLEPGLMFIGFLILSFLFGYALWPVFDKSISPTYWDTWTLPMKYFQTWYANHWWWVTLVWAGLVVLIFRSRPVWVGKLRRIADYLPPWSIYRDMQAIQTLVVLGSLTSAGLTLDSSLQRMMRGAPRYLRWHLATMQRLNLSNNASIVRTFSTGLFNSYIVDRVSDAAQSKDFNDVMKYVAGTSLRSISRKLIFRAKVLNMVGIAIVASLFGYLAAVQTLGIQDAVGRFESEIGSVRHRPAVPR